MTGPTVVLSVVLKQRGAAGLAGAVSCVETHSICKCVTLQRPDQF